MISFPNAKINIGLFVCSRRPDGYHNIQTLFFPVKGLFDSLEIVENDSKKDEFSTSGLIIEGTPTDNLIIKALRLMREYVAVPPLKIHLHKLIPSGAGLGGGSADAAFMLKLLSDKFSLGLSKEKLEAMAAKLGADCPVFIENKPVLAGGIGNEFQPADINLSGYTLQIVVPPIHVSTAKAYSQIKPALPSENLGTLVKHPVQEWWHLIANDFEIPVFGDHPEIKKIKETMYDNGAVYASMSGSGSAVFGLFKSKPDKPWTSTYFVHTEEI